MPLYEYLCSDCDRPQELLVRSEADPVSCPDCGSGRMQKLLSVCATPASATRNEPPPPGPCGSACGCFPAG